VGACGADDSFFLQLSINAASAAMPATDNMPDVFKNSFLSINYFFD